MLITKKEALKTFTPETRLWQGIPAIEKTKGGKLFAALYSGNTKETVGNYCALLESRDDGETWKDPVAVAYIGEHGRCYDPCLWIDPNGRLWFIWAEHPERCVKAAICEEPDAETLIWSEVFEIGGEVLLNKPVVLSTGEWLFPSAIWDSRLYGLGGDGNLAGENTIGGSAVFKSTDRGKTISRIGGAIVPSRSFDEHMLLEKQDGTIHMYVRTNYGIGESVSYDRGKTWTTAFDSKLGGPCSRFHIRRLKSGNVLLINHVNFSGRNNLTALLSDDDGKTWKWSMLIDGRDEVSYPDAIEDDCGNIYVIYDRERGCFKKSMAEAQKDAREILLCKFTEEDIKQGGAAKPVCSIVSKLGEYRGENKNPYGELALYSDEEYLSLLINTPEPHTVLDKIFDRYGVSCSRLHNIDRKALDSAILELIEGGGSLPVIEKIISILSANKKTTAGADTLFGRMMDYVSDNLSSDFTLDDMAESFSASKFYLCHLFKEKTGTSLYRYRQELRLSKAKKLLLETELSLGDIAEQSGFCDQSYFTKLFKFLENITPAEYRKLNK